MTEAFFERADTFVRKAIVKLASRRNKDSQGFALAEALAEVRKWEKAYEREAKGRDTAERRVVELEAREACWMRVTDTLKARLDTAEDVARGWRRSAILSTIVSVVCFAGALWTLH